MPVHNERLSLFQQDAIRAALDRFNAREAERRARVAAIVAAARRRQIFRALAFIAAAVVVSVLAKWGTR